MSDITMNDRLIAAKECSERWGLSPNYLSRLARSGEVDVVRFGRAVRFVESSLVSWVNQQRSNVA